MKFFGDGKNEPTNWKKCEKLGTGAFGKVFHALVCSDETTKSLAVKKIDVSDEKTMGNLHEYIEDYGEIPEMRSSRLAKTMIEAVGYIHLKHYFHRDIKSKNVLMFDDHHIKLADFGLNKEYRELQDTCTSNIGTVRFMAPEMVRQRKYDKAVDVWALGCVILHMVTGKQPHYYLPESQQIIFRLGQDNPSPSPINKRSVTKSLSDVCIEFLRLIFVTDPLLRPDVLSLLHTRFISGITESLYVNVNICEERKTICCSDHSTFISATCLTIEDLPVGYREDNVVNFIQCLAGLTVQVNHINSLHGVDSGIKQNYHFQIGTGRIGDVFQEEDNCISCPCELCKISGPVKREVWNIFVFTAFQVLNRSSSARALRFKWVHDTDQRKDKTFYGSKILWFSSCGDLGLIYCVTCDKELAFALISIIKLFNISWQKIRANYMFEKTCYYAGKKYKKRKVIAISHSHGRQKTVSFGEVLGKKLQAIQTSVGFLIHHDADICSGNIGAPS